MSNTTTPGIHEARKARTMKIVVASAAGLCLAGVVTASGIVMSDSHGAAHADAAPHKVTSTPATSTPASQIPPTPSQPRPAPADIPSVPSHPSGPTPSASVASLQRELGQLNYYEGPDDGLSGPQTIQAIKDLQREAGLPQTGVMNAATDGALIHQLTYGNSQMGGNS